MAYTFPLRPPRRAPASLRSTVYAAPQKASPTDEVTRAKGERRLRARIEAGWFGWPSRFGPAQPVVDLGVTMLGAVEKVFIKPTHSKGSDHRR